MVPPDMRIPVFWRDENRVRISEGHIHIQSGLVGSWQFNLNKLSPLCKRRPGSERMLPLAFDAGAQRGKRRVCNRDITNTRQTERRVTQSLTTETQTDAAHGD